jgi:hypothetical protein
MTVEQWVVSYPCDVWTNETFFPDWVDQLFADGRLTFAHDLSALRLNLEDRWVGLGDTLRFDTDSRRLESIERQR